MRAQHKVVKAHCIVPSDEAEFLITEGRIIWTVLWKSSFYVTEMTVRVRYEDQIVYAGYVNSLSLL
jgi:hypothetical protein